MELAVTKFPMDDYCEAIGFSGPLQRNLACVTALAHAQIMNIAFENLDVLACKPISMEPQDIIQKLLYSARGGYCYELNGLFSLVLQAMQVPHRLLLARPMIYAAKRARTHMVIVAELDQGPYLIDVGFGSYGPRQPIALDQLNTAITQGPEQFRLSLSDDQEYVLAAHVDDEWQNQYAFNLTPQEWVDFVPANYFNSNHPDSLFVQKPVILIHQEHGRSILLGNQLKTVHNGKVTLQEIDEVDLDEILEDIFGIELDV